MSGSHRSQRSLRGAYTTRYRKPFGARIKDCCRSTIAFMFSNVGVCGLMVGYTIMGALLFPEIEVLEGPPLSSAVVTHREEAIRRLWNITASHNTLYPTKWKDDVRKELKDYQEYIVEIAGRGWIGEEPSNSSDNARWSFEAGFFYSLTVITTIGE